ncbi:hypothetical protein Bca4012_083510 [Brassica carinata]
MFFDHLLFLKVKDSDDDNCWRRGGEAINTAMTTTGGWVRDKVISCLLVVFNKLREFLLLLYKDFRYSNLQLVFIKDCEWLRDSVVEILKNPRESPLLVHL